MMRPTSLTSTASITDKNTATTATKINTTDVDPIVSARVGYETFLSSAPTSWKNSLTLAINLFIVSSSSRSLGAGNCVGVAQPAHAGMAGQEGFEPPSRGFGDRCSSRWSYWPNRASSGATVAVTSLLYERFASGIADNTSSVPTDPACSGDFWSWNSCVPCNPDTPRSRSLA